MVTVVAVQPRINLVYPAADRFDDTAIDRNIDISIEHIQTAKDEYDADLVLFPEFFLTSYTLDVDVPGWIKASVRMPGPEMDRLCEAAIANKTYVAGAAYEVMDEFPGRFFNTAFLIAPSGDIILRYRKLYAMTTKTRPSDVLDEWIDKFGIESLFPVAHTPIGRIAMMIARDAHWPEMARCYAMKGAEILLNPNAASAEPKDGGRFARQSRAYENHCYVVTSNIGPFVADGRQYCKDGRAPCEVIDFHGEIIAHEESEAEMLVAAELDMPKLRRFRVNAAGKGNMLAQLQPALHAPFYDRVDLFPANGWRDTPIISNDENKAMELATVQRMIENGILLEPQ